MAAARKTQGVLLAGVALMMLGLAFAAVPLYQMFCQQTGFGGTPKIVYAPGPQASTNRQLTIQFTANVERNLPLIFKPLQHRITVNAGDMGLAFYQVENTSDQPVVGMATYNVTPDKAGPYFNKVACFCFERQVIHPHQKMDMAVQFFIDPDLATERELNDVNVITLSYTFFRLKE